MSSQPISAPVLFCSLSLLDHTHACYYFNFPNFLFGSKIIHKFNASSGVGGRGGGGHTGKSSSTWAPRICSFMPCQQQDSYQAAYLVTVSGRQSPARDSSKAPPLSRGHTAVEAAYPWQTCQGQFKGTATFPAIFEILNFPLISNFHFGSENIHIFNTSSWGGWECGGGGHLVGRLPTGRLPTGRLDIFFQQGGFQQGG